MFPMYGRSKRGLCMQLQSNTTRMTPAEVLKLRCTTPSLIISQNRPEKLKLQGPYTLVPMSC